MNMEPLKVKCPSCGALNDPFSVKVRRDFAAQVYAEYECNNMRVRKLNVKKPCATRYTIERNGQDATLLINQMSEC